MRVPLCILSPARTLNGPPVFQLHVKHAFASYICVYVLHLNEHIITYIHIQMYVNNHIYVCIIYVCIDVLLFIHINIEMYLYNINMYISIYIYIDIDIYIHKHVRIHMHRHTHTHTHTHSYTHATRHSSGFSLDGVISISQL